MKKLLSLLLACMLLFLTACNQTPPNETTSDNSQTQETVDFKDTIIRNGYSDFMDLPSRIVFEQSGQVCYYSKADGKAYVYCFDPLCDHRKGTCFADPDAVGPFVFILSKTFFINNRFYAVSGNGQIFSYAFDGSDLKIEYEDETCTPENMNHYLWSQIYSAYDKYIYIPLEADENGNPHLLRFNTKTKEMEDLTEKTGNHMYPVLFYNGEIYGRGERYQGWYKADLEMKNMESIEALQVGSQFYGSIFFDNAYDNPTDYKNRKTIGIQAHNIKTGETTVFTNEMLGLEANRYVIVAVDENYVYFYQYKKIFVGTYIDARGNERTREKENEGKLYRVKHDGTECTLIYDNPEFEFSSMDAVVCGKKLILEGCYIGIRNGVAEVWDSAMKVGTIGEDGKIDKFENIELVY